MISDDPRVFTTIEDGKPNVPTCKTASGRHGERDRKQYVSKCFPDLNALGQTLSHGPWETQIQIWYLNQIPTDSATKVVSTIFPHPSAAGTLHPGSKISSSSGSPTELQMTICSSPAVRRGIVGDLPPRLGPSNAQTETIAANLGNFSPVRPADGTGSAGGVDRRPTADVAPGLAEHAFEPVARRP